MMALRLRQSLHRHYGRAMSFSTTTATATTTETGKATTTAAKSIAERVAARVRERDSWPTSHTPTLSEVFNMLTKGASVSPLPSQEEMDRDFPVQPIDWPKLQRSAAATTAEVSPPSSPPPFQITWIGHATCLVQMGGFTVLTDPIFSQRCAPVQFFGPARFRPPACTCDELLEHLDLDVVVISHNHYDHLDYNSIRDLSQKSRKALTFVVPLGLAKWMRNTIRSSEERQHNIVELDWHESYTYTHSTSSNNNKSDDDNNNKSDTTTTSSDKTDDGLVLTCVPAQHWSNRIGWDRDQTLWCGYSLKTQKNNHNQSALFSGDTAWFEGLHDIGKNYGPFDVAMIPIGAYEPRDFMKSQHANPSEAVKIMSAVQAVKAIPIHWGTFRLTTEPYLEPREKLAEAVEEAGLEPTRFGSWLIGETVSVEKVTNKR
jgi:N-acyl-phosphatidylethanolamine-hydrolysing phospholipase D